MRLRLFALASSAGLLSIVFAGCVGDTATPPNVGVDASTDTNVADTNVADTADSGCGDTSSSADNCGSCGHKCSMGNQCFKGICGNIPIQLAGSPSAIDNCVVLASGRVYCWGDNANGEGGTNDKASHNFAALIPQDNTKATFDHVVEVAVGFKHTCARKDDGSIWCWGYGAFGETGISINAADALVPQRVGALIGYTAIRAGGFATCGIDSSGQVFCWGTNDHAVLGHTPNTNSDMSTSGNSCTGATQEAISWNNAVPVKIAGIAGATSLYMGDQWGCALDGSKTVKCWGGDDYGQLGDVANTTNVPLSPCSKGLTPLANVGAPTAIGGSKNEGCVLYGASADMKCWGYNHDGELATGTLTGSQLTPWGTSVKGVAASGGEFHLCVLLTSGKVQCAGANDHNALGSGAPTPSKAPIDVLIGSTPIDNVTQIASGYFSTCALRKDGTVWCWGDNTNGPGGRLGDGSNLPRVGAVQVVGLPQ